MNFNTSWEGKPAPGLDSKDFSPAPLYLAEDKSIAPTDSGAPWIDPAHLAEWRASGIDDLVTLANLRSASGSTAWGYLLYTQNPIKDYRGEKTPLRINTGGLTSAARKTYAHLDAGGWWVGNTDPVKGEERLWGQFKPNNPRKTRKRDRNGNPQLGPAGEELFKPIKYETPPGEPVEPIFLKIPDPIAAKIAAKNGAGEMWEMAREDGAHFWEWVAARPKEIPLEITEGLKKTAALVSHGSAAIGLTGIWNWQIPQSNPKEPLPDLAPFLTPGRKIIIDFDQDDKPQTLEMVATAIKHLGEMAEKRGCTVWVRVWDGELGKGIDDLIAAHPDNWESLTQVLPLSEGLRYFWKRQGRYPWRQSKEFSAQITLSQRYLNYQDFQPGNIYFIKSGLGSGKTRNLQTWIEANRETWLKRNRLFFLGYRNNLLLQNCAAIRGLVHIQQFDETDLINDPTLWAALCLDSLGKFRPEDLDGGVIVLDEVVSVYKHLLHAKTEIKRDRPKIMELFQEAIRRAKIVICLDGNLADWIVKAIASIDPTKGVITIENSHPTPRPELYWIPGTNYTRKDGTTYLCKNAYQGLIDEIGGSGTGAKAVCADSQTSLETIDSLLTGLGYNVFRIDSKTAGNPQVKAFLENSTAWLKANPIDYLLYSPTAESGLDIPITGYFSAHYCLFFGVLDVDSALQMIARVRDLDCPKFVWAREWAPKDDSGFFSPIPDVLERAYHERVFLDAHRILSGEDSGPQIISEILESYQRAPKHFSKAAFYGMAQRNYERANFRECLLERVKVGGYPVATLTPAIRELGEAFKPEKEKVQREDARKIYEAETKPLNKIFPQNEADQYCQRKAIILDQLPGIDRDPVWGADFIFHILYKERNLRRQARLFWLLGNLGVNHRLEMEKVKRAHDRFFNGGYGLLWLDRNEWALVWALSESGLLAILSDPDPDKVWGPEDPAIQTVLENCRRRRQLQTHLGKPGGANPMQYLGKLLGMVGAGWAGKNTKRGGNQIREYRLDLSAHDSPEWAAMTGAITRKRAKYFSTALEPVLFQKTNTYYQKSESALLSQYSDPQNRSGDAFEPVAPDPKISISPAGCILQPPPYSPETENSAQTSGGVFSYTQSEFSPGDRVIFHSFTDGPVETEISAARPRGLYLLKNGVLTPAALLEKIGA